MNIRDGSLGFLLVFVLILGLFHPAMSEEEPLAEQLRKNFKKEYLKVGFLIQVVGDGQIERSFSGHSGFYVSNLRLILTGKLDKNFGYHFKANFIRSPAILDGFMYYQFSRNFTLDMGFFKAPFSREFLTGAEAIDMVNRPVVVSALGPGRQIGVQARGALDSKSTVQYRLGLFNGNGYGNNNNDNEDFMYAGRLAFFPQVFNDRTAGSLEIGVNAAYSNDDGARIMGSNFNGKRTLLGGDVRLVASEWLLAAEYIHANLKTDGFEERSFNPNGFYITGGYMPDAKNQLLVRWDGFHPDGLARDSDLLIFGFNHWPTSMTEFQVNYIINTDDSEFKHHQVLVNAQVAF